ncbi:MAG: hypothetical protein IJ181_12240, partial [Acidaminococcaceae bacterium]|nr:hypothetical protein [Acidaminococcaceae bacterium]
PAADNGTAGEDAVKNILIFHKKIAHRVLQNRTCLLFHGLYVPAALKLGLFPQTVSPLRHISSHGITQTLPMFCVIPVRYLFI